MMFLFLFRVLSAIALSLSLSLSLSLQIHFTVTDAFSSIAMASPKHKCPPTKAKATAFPHRRYCYCIRSTSLDSTKASNTEDVPVPPTRLPTIRVRAAVYQPPLAEIDADADAATTTTTTTTKPTQDGTNPLAVLTEIADVLNTASRCGIDLVQFPEYFLSGGGDRWVPDRSEGGALSAPLDRDASTLNIVGNLCAELGVACIVGYAEKEHESEHQSEHENESEHEENDDTDAPDFYNALALFHADGSRAGNYRCVHPSRSDGLDPSPSPSAKPKPGHTLVEAIPIALRLPDRGDSSAGGIREVRVGPLCGNDPLVPEHARHLTRSGAQILAVAGSTSQSKSTSGALVAERVLPTRSIENGLPLLFSNYCGSGPDADEGESENENENENRHQGGRSTVVSLAGMDLVRAPCSVYGDMPASDGYFLPCGGTGGGGTGGAALYAADLDVPVHDNDNDNDDDNKTLRSSPRSASLDEWDLTPRITGLDAQQDENVNANVNANINANVNANTNGKPPARGFGREVVELLEKQQQAKRKKQKRLSKRK